MRNATVSRMDRALLQQRLAERGEPAFRAAQVWEWAARGARGYEEMTNLPAALRGALPRSVPFSTLSVEHEAEARDGTVKILFRTHEGHPVEAARALPDLGITWRRTTVSTVGWLPGLRRFVDEVEEPIRLALSLHSPTDELGSELMPVNRR